MFCVAACAIAQQMPIEKVLHTYDWQDLMAQHPFLNSEIVSMDGMSVLKIENTNSTPLEIDLLEITNASILNQLHSISCDIKYENVENTHGNSSSSLHKMVESSQMITMDMGSIKYNTWGAGGLETTRLLLPDAPGGDVKTNGSYSLIAGTSNWLPCGLPVALFSETDLVRVDLKLFLPGTGTVYLRPVKLMGYTQRGLSPQLGVVIGVSAGLGGAGIGCFGALIGCLVGMGKARRFVLAMAKIFIGLGILLMMAGIIAAACHQPWPVWYSLLLAGFVLTIVFSVNLYPIKRRYDELEIRRMTSMDAAGG
jgi:hypothetical protein